jgi:hypothetical protein
MFEATIREMSMLSRLSRATRAKDRAVSHRLRFVAWMIAAGVMAVGGCRQNDPQAARQSEESTDAASASSEASSSEEPPYRLPDDRLMTPPNWPEQQKSGLQPSRKLPPIAEHWRRLSDKDEVWIDLEEKRVIVGGEICLNAGLLEMFACPYGSRAHESIVSVNAPADLVHAGLLAVGAQPGSPVEFDPEFRPASGPIVKVDVVWMEGDAERRLPAQQMIQDMTTGEAMQHDWVFCGSRLWTDPESGENFYMANSGELICVSNFTTAMMDLPIQSTDRMGELMFQAFEGKVPLLGTRVLVILTPQLESATEGGP